MYKIIFNLNRQVHAFGNLLHCYSQNLPSYHQLQNVKLASNTSPLDLQDYRGDKIAENYPSS